MVPRSWLSVDGMRCISSAVKSWARSEAYHGMPHLRQMIHWRSVASGGPQPEELTRSGQSQVA